MGTIRLKNICKDIQLGIIPIVDYLNTLGAEIKDIDPNMEVPMEYIPALKERFGQPQKEILPDNRPPINNPIRAKHRPGLFGKKILLLDGFYGTTSRDLRDYYIDGISNNDVFAEIPETLLAAGKTLCSLFGKQFDITEFMDNCAFYCCDKEDGVQDKDAHSRRRQKIDETVELLEPDIVIVLSKWVKDFLGMNSGSVLGKGHLLSKRIETANGFATDFIYIKDPFWLSEKDWEGFLTPDSGDNSESDAVCKTESLFNNLVCNPNSDFFSFTRLGYAENLEFNWIRKLFDFLVKENKVEGTDDNLLILAYHLTGKLLPEYARLAEQKILWKGSWKGHTFVSFIKTLVGEETRKGKPWIHAANAFCFLGENGCVDCPDNKDLSDEYKSHLKSQSLVKDPFIERFKRLFLSN